MSSCLSICDREAVRARALECGASVCGFARVEPVGYEAELLYSRWVGQGCHGSMAYCAKYADVRSNPGLLLEGARTVVSMAFNYYNQACAMPLSPLVARYAWGYDYHYVLKRRLVPLCGYLTSNFGGECRILVDTAPMRERYWAVKAGIGFVGINNQLIVPGRGSYFFLAEVLWTGEIPPDAPCTESCDGCGACARSCPGAALDGCGGCDARRCVSYLTIENRDVPSPGTPLGGYAYGCDICQRVCPHNAGAESTGIEEFLPVNPLLKYTPQQLCELSSSQYRKLTAHTAMSRVPLSKLKEILMLSQM